MCQHIWDFSLQFTQTESDQNLYNFLNPESKTDGIINEILNILKVYSVDDDFGQSVLNILENVKEIRRRLQGDKEAEFYILRKLCLKLSNMMRTPKKSTGIDWQGLSDILYFYSLTFTYFNLNEFYIQVQSEKEVTVRKCDLPDFTQYFTKREGFFVDGLMINFGL